jgi:NNP family nitrate/nitrite transporter-like MFS transporter
MRLKHFLAAGHMPTLVSAFLYFDVSFMVWVMIGALANSIAADFELGDAQKGFMVAVPILGGAMLRIPLGVLADRFGGRRTAILSMGLTVIPLVLCWQWSDSFPQLLLAGLLLGIAGASFAVALPLAGRWYPPEHQGLAMGIAGAGNSGTALAALFAPRLAEYIGWQAVFGAALVPLLAVLVFFCAMAKDSPRQPKPKQFRE